MNANARLLGYNRSNLKCSAAIRFMRQLVETEDANSTSINIINLLTNLYAYLTNMHIFEIQLIKC